MIAYGFRDTPEKNIEKIMKYLSKKLSKGIITDKEYKVFEYRVKYHKTLEEVGAIFGVTRERIRQVENKADRKLRYEEQKKKLKPLSELLKDTSEQR